MKPNLQHEVVKEQKGRKVHMTIEQVIEHLILEKKFMQEIMVKDRNGYQPRYLKNLVHNCSLWNYCKIRRYGMVILISYINAMEKILTS